MAHDENYDELKKQLDEYKEEKERVRMLLGQIGSSNNLKKDKYINIVFLSIVVSLFALGAIFKTISMVLSLELGVLLVSLKIAWMIHEQSKVNHFQFWVLTTVEFKVTELSSKIQELQKKINGK